MGALEVDEFSTRLLYIYVAEVTLGLIFFFIFRHFGHLYRRRFLITWALSWIAYATFMGTSGTVQVFLLGTQSLFRDAVSIIAQLACFLQIILILRGTYELIYEKAFSRRNFSNGVWKCWPLLKISCEFWKQGNYHWDWISSRGIGCVDEPEIHQRLRATVALQFIDLV
jgi:hypothetical protein